MIICDRQEAIEWMNRYGCEAHPFVFVVNYARNCTLIEEPSCSDTLVIISMAIPMSRLPLMRLARHAPRYGRFIRAALRIICTRLTGATATRCVATVLANLTCATPVTTDCTLREIYARTEAPYKLWLKNHFVSFSPNRLSVSTAGVSPPIR